MKLFQRDPSRTRQRPGGALRSLLALAAFAVLSARAENPPDPPTRDRTAAQTSSGRVAVSDSSAASRLTDEAEAAYREQRWDTAMDAFKAVVALQPEHAHGWLRIGNLHHRRGQWLPAASAYRKSADHAQRSPGAVGTRTKALLNLAAVNLEMADAALAQAGSDVGEEATELRRRQAQAVDRHQTRFTAIPPVASPAAVSPGTPSAPPPAIPRGTSRAAGHASRGPPRSTEARTAVVGEREPMATVEYLSPPHRP